MRTMKGSIILEKKCTEPILNIFTAYLSDGRKVTFRQPRRADVPAQRRAWKEITERNRRRYRRVHVDQSIYDMNKRCKIPLYKGEFPGILPLTIEVDDEVVGFSDIFFKLGADFERFNVEPTDKCANGSIIVLDQFQGMGVGFMYSEMSDFIARHYGCKTILGRTFVRGGMRGIRGKDDWQIVWTDGKLVDYKKQL